MAKEHIMHSDIVSKMRQSNRDEVGKIMDELREQIKPITNKYDSIESGDVCIHTLIYIRKGNDVVTLGSGMYEVSTSQTASDMSSRKFLTLDGFVNI